MGSLKPVQNLPETSQTLSKYEDRPGQMKTFLAYTNNNFSWPPSMPEYMRRYCFHQITEEFLGHENDWVTVYNQEIKAYGKEYSDDELNHIFKEMPGAIQLPVNQKSLPHSKKRKMVTTKHVIDNGTLGDEGWNLRPIAGSGYGDGVAEIHANKIFEVRLSDRRNWTKWVPAKITVWD
ncbi:hypothetical protein GLOIN_2v1782186 [Rhizophagus irregularis DAOM 181602=DAOM 197198]|nr:hypothetical protein GLOIN_2v1782186 [Rhizophagus irregularis DAOM 181602=DAOM 197198]